MNKTIEELNKLKQEYDLLKKELKELTDEELKVVTGDDFDTSWITREKYEESGASIVGKGMF